MKNRPFLKWAGNKYRILDKILKHLPQGKRLVEPFVGSGAVFLNSQYHRYLLAETNPDLINLYRIIKEDGPEFIEFARRYMDLKNNNPNRYYALRELFNETDDVWTKSALFIYLNRHGYNGLCRYNKSWQFNVPFGTYKKPYYPEEQLRHFHSISQNARFACQDFRHTMQKAKYGDVIYCDPPYAPLSETANFTHYGGTGFDTTDQEDLVAHARDCQARGIPVIISNHDTTYTRELYQDAKLKGFRVTRTISRDGATRKRVKELIALYLPEEH